MSSKTKNVFDSDFSSLYPSIIKAYRIDNTMVYLRKIKIKKILNDIR